MMKDSACDQNRLRTTVNILYNSKEEFVLYIDIDLMSYLRI